MYETTIYGHKFNIILSDWRDAKPGKQEECAELICAELERFSPVVVSKVHADMLLDQCDGAGQFAIKNAEDYELNGEFWAVCDVPRLMMERVLDGAVGGQYVASISAVAAC